MNRAGWLAFPSDFDRFVRTIDSSLAKTDSPGVISTSHTRKASLSAIP